MGGMEFGPRALGSRSILGDPRSPRMQAQMNLRSSSARDSGPFAPSVLVERAGDYFELDVESPYMLMVAPVRKSDGCLPNPGKIRLGNRPAEHSALGYPRCHTPRSHGAHPDSLQRNQPGLL